MTGVTDKASSVPGPDAAASGTPVRLWVVVLAACAGQFLVVLDVSVVNVALPSMRTDLGLDAAGLQWVLNGYTLAFAGLMLLGGRAADIYGRKRTFLVGLALFTAASLLGGLAQQPWHLLAARIVQGTGAAVLAPATLTILTTAFPPGRARTRAIATWSAVGAGGGAAGGLVGGVLTDALSWRWVLLINVPVGALVLLAAAVWVSEGRDASARRRLDVPGALLVTLGLGVLAWGIVRTEAVGWTAPSVLWPLVAGPALLLVFVAVEARTQDPLVPLHLFRSRAVSAANAAMFVCGGALFCMWYFMTLYMQNVLHYTPLQAGLGFIPQSLSIVLGSKAAPRLMVRFGARNVALAGVVLAGAGCLWQSGMYAGGGFLLTVTGPGVLMALGGGLAGTPLASVAMSGAPHGDAGLVSGLFNTARTMGGSLGLAVFSTIAAARIGDGTGPEILASGYGLAFRSAAAVLVLCAALVLFVLPRPDRESTHGDGEDGPAAGTVPPEPLTSGTGNPGPKVSGES
ncbi:MFS transporter [Streptomyces bathyalis]|uniref:MFS transporter n=1 Tax=Streptomyces bathyalis TaxID=2710756 RepID=A0A7T1WSE4_9ACTN|nr:MFS transporter [Streptomyces bathyalis]QPP09098.1 MFS transporter [Streptomyces bathyalis]